MAILRYVRIVARSTFAIVNNLYCIPAYVVWMMALHLVRPLYAPLYWKIEGFMYHWLLAMVSMWSWTAGYERADALAPAAPAGTSSFTPPAPRQDVERQCQPARAHPIVLTVCVL